MSKRFFAALILTLILVFVSFTGTVWSSQKVAGDAIQQKTLHSSKELVDNDTTKPSLSITSPSSLRAGTAYTIRWTASDASGIAFRTVDFYNGSTWVTIGTPLSVDTLSWTVATAYAPTDSCRFRITVVDASPNANMTIGFSSWFTIDTICYDRVAITMPAQISIGISYKITWIEDTCSQHIISRVLLWSKNSGTTYDTLAKPTTNSFIWNVPSSAIGPCRARIVVTYATSRTVTATSGAFAILDLTPPSISITNPNGGEQWRVNSIQQIKWTASDNVGVTRRIIAYTTNGTTFNTISDDNSNTGVFLWQLPTDSANTAWVKISVYDARGNKVDAISAAPFKILSSTAIVRNAHHAFTSASDYFGISTTGKTIQCGVNAGAYSVKVYDLAGRLLISRNAVATQEMYQNIPVKSSNVSIVRLEQAGKIITKKVMLQ